MKQVYEVLTADSRQFSKLVSGSAKFEDFKAEVAKAMVKNLDVSAFPEASRGKVEQLTKKKEELKHLEEKEEGTLSNLEKEIAKLSQEVSSLKRAVEDQNDSRESQERKLKREQQELANLDRKLEELLHENKEAKQTLQRLQAEAQNGQQSSSSSADEEDDGSYEVIAYEDLSIRGSYGKTATGDVSVGHRTGEKVFVKKFSTKRAFDDQVHYIGQLHSGYVLQMFGANARHRFLALEYLPKNLDSLSLDTNQEISWEKKWGIARDILLALLYLHSRNPPVLKGRDAGLKAFNVFVGADWAAKVALPGVLPSNIDSEDEDIWTAPEVSAGSEEFSDKSDVWSYGLVLWQLATRKRPFSGAKAGKIKANEDELNTALDLPEDAVPQDFRKLLDSCLLYSSRRRPTFTRLLKQFKDKGLLANRVEYLKIAAGKIEDIEREISIQQQLVEKAERQAEQGERRYNREKSITEDTIRQKEEIERKVAAERQKLAELERKAEELQANAERARKTADEDEKKKKKQLKKEEANRQRELEELQAEKENAERKFENAKKNNEQLRRNLEDLESQIESERSRRTDAERRRDDYLRRA